MKHAIIILVFILGLLAIHCSGSTTHTVGLDDETIDAIDGWIDNSEEEQDDTGDDTEDTEANPETGRYSLGTYYLSTYWSTCDINFDFPSFVELYYESEMVEGTLEQVVEIHGDDIWYADVKEDYSFEFTEDIENDALHDLLTCSCYMTYSSYSDDWMKCVCDYETCRTWYYKEN